MSCPVFIKHFFEYASEGLHKFFQPSPPVEVPGLEKTDTVSHSHEKVLEYLPNPRLSRLYSRDFEDILHDRDMVISGYLNIGQADGWAEGGTLKIGISFTRYILSRFLFQNGGKLDKNAAVVKATLKAFKNCEDLSGFFNPIRRAEGNYPQESRVCYDPSVGGWHDHAVSRLVGNVGSTYNPSKPFFEILVNSARSSAGDDYCRPFFISIFANKEEVEDRRRRLQSIRLLPANIAHFSFYASCLKNPQEFMKMHQKKLGPNSSRLLQGLIYLQNVTLYAQKTGNCWIKQPMRCLLASFYVELITHRPDLTPKQAWDEAIGLYKRVQRDIAVPLVRDLIAQSDARMEMKKNALLALERQDQVLIKEHTAT